MKHFPAIYQSEEQNEQTETNGQTHPKLIKFKNNVLSIIKNIFERLQIVEEFVDGTQSLPQAMTVAVTVRDITMVLISFFLLFNVFLLKSNH